MSFIYLSSVQCGTPGMRSSPNTLVSRAVAMHRNDRGPTATHLRRGFQARKGDQTGGKTVGTDVRYGDSVARLQRWNRCVARDVVQRVVRRTHHVDGFEWCAVTLGQRLDRGNSAIDPSQARHSAQMN